MKKLGFLAGVVAAIALPQLADAQDRPSDLLIDGGQPIQIEREPNTLGPVTAVPRPERRPLTRRATKPRLRSVRLRRAG